MPTRIVTNPQGQTFTQVYSIYTYEEMLERSQFIRNQKKLAAEEDPLHKQWREDNWAMEMERNPDFQPVQGGKFYKADCPHCGAKKTYYTHPDHSHCFSCGAHGGTSA